MLPGLSGIEFTRRLKRNDATRGVPIIMVTARDEENDRVTGLEAGVDDYINKPFSLRELVARINAVLRRSAPPDDERVEIGGLLIDPGAHRVFATGTPVTH